MSKLFHSLVVCGAGLTVLQCGGRSVQQGDDPSLAGAGGSPGVAGSPGIHPSGGHGGSVSLGGSTAAGGVASSAFGGTGSISVGGTAAVAGAPGFAGSSGFGVGGAPWDTSNPWQQWDCTADNATSCATAPGSQVSGVGLFHSCAASLARPRSPSDCAPGTVYSCLIGVLGSVTGPVNCECLAPSALSGPCPCPQALVSCSGATPVACSTDQSYCGCAYTCILK